MKTNIKEHLKFRKFAGLINESQYKRLILESVEDIRLFKSIK
jgi:hypothetical protein